MTLEKKLSQIYLTLVPFATLALGLGIGHTSYMIYLPVWMLHACIMMIAIWLLGPKRPLRTSEPERKDLAAIGIFLLLPWVFISIFGGMGPPSSTIAEWVATATEQQIRYYILIGAGVLIAFGSTLLKGMLNSNGENFYSRLGFTAIVIAIPLFIINMAFWGSFLTTSFNSFIQTPAAKKPDWYFAIRDLFYTIALAEVALIYLATAAFAISLKVIGIFRPATCKVYITISILGLIISLLPPTSPKPLAYASFLFSIPAIPFLMPYLMGIQFLRRAGD